MTRKQAWIDITLLLGLTVAITVITTFFATMLVRNYVLSSMLISQGVVILLVLRFLLFYRGQSWVDIGLHRMQTTDLKRALYAIFACLGCNFIFISLTLVFNPGLFADHLQRLVEVTGKVEKGMSFTGIAVMLLFIGIYEELFARGFLLTRLRTALEGNWAPILASSAMFGLGHVYQGWFGVTQTTLIGVVLAYLTLRWGTLWPAILAHTSLNLLSISTLDAITEKLS